VDLQRISSTFRAIRISRGWRQLDVANKASVSRAAVSRLERGRLGELPLDEILGIAVALDISLRLSATWQGGELDRLLNARHAALHESVARRFVSWADWELAPEVSFSIWGERGVIDILAWHAPTRTLLVIELKTEIVDISELMGSVDRKRRLAPEIAAERGWQPLTVAVWVIVADSTTNRRRVQHHYTTLRAAFPVDGRTMRRWLDRPAGSLAALSFWSNARAGDTKLRFATVKRVRRPRARAC
jgi:transcriptional regulator with XRE-family HTH domain